MKAIKYAALAVGAVALIATGVGAVALGGLAGTLTVAGISTSTLFLVAGGLSVAASLLQKGPKVPASQTDRLSANIDPRAFRKSWLGQTAAPVDIRYEEWSGNNQEYCDWIVALASHGADGVDEIWLNAEMAWSQTTGPYGKYAGYFSVPNIVLEGSPANAFTFASGKWNAVTARLTGCAYLRMRFKVTGNSKKAESPFASGIPSRITIIGRGAKLYDPRRDSTVPGGSGPMRWNDQSTWRYTTDDGAVIGENLPLQILFRVLGWRIRNPSTGAMKLAVGSGVPARRIALESFQVAASLADELVNRAAGGNEPRYHGAGVVSEGDDPKTTLDALCAACCGRFRDTSGKLSLVIMHNDLAAAATDDGLVDDDVIGAFTWDPDPSLEATPNIARGKYVDASTASLYQLVDYPEVALPSPDGQDRIFPLDLGFVESPSHAQRIAKQVLQRKQYLREFSAPFDIRAWKYGVGDVVPFTFAPLGFTRALFRVKQQEQGQGSTCNMVLSFESPAFYAWDANDALPVMAADPIVYDSRNNPLILAIEDAGKSAEWDGITGDGKPADNATNSGDPDSPFGRDDSVAAILARLAEARRNATEGLEQIEAANVRLDEARADIDKTAANARLTLSSVLAGQLLEQRRKARTDMLTHLNGVQVGVVIQQETTQRIEGEVATASFLSLIGAKNSTGTGIIFNSDTVFVSPDQSLAEKFVTIEAQFEGVASDASAAITRLDRAISDEKGARTEAIEAAQSDFTTKIGTATTSIADLTRTTADADHALGERITQTDASFQAALIIANATIATVQRAVADETGARTTAITNLGTSFDTKLGDAVSTVTRDYRQAVSDEAGARATAITDLGANFTNALGNAILATTTNFNQAIADEAGARATQFGSVTARLDRVGGGSSSVEQLFSAQADALGNLSARASLAVTAGGVWSGITVTAADGSAGTISDITMSAMTINVSTAKLIFNNGSVMKVLGTGFGVGNEFIDWFGPSMPFAQCSRTNGIVWQTVTGDAYFGGSLSAGVLTNGAQSSSVGPDVIADTGGFGSNGGKITVVISWFYSWSLNVRYSGSASSKQAFDNAAAAYGATSEDGNTFRGTRTETGNPTLILSREIGGAARIDVATPMISKGVGTFQGSRPLAEGEPGQANFTADWSVSLTYTDPDRIIADRRFIATLARGFTAGSGEVSQRVGIITTEE